MLTRGYRFAFVLLLLMFFAGAGIAFTAARPGNLALYLAPALASIAVLVIFAVVLQRQVGENVFGEVGFLYLGLTVAYTVLPALAFLVAGIGDEGPFAQLLPEPADLSTHLWRHVLFAGGVAGGYLVARGHEGSHAPVAAVATERDGRALLFVVALIVVCVSAQILMSAPVHSYADHYVRYDHLPWLPRKFVSLSIRLGLGLYCVLLVLLFRNYRKYKLVIPLVVLTICGYELVHTFGARIVPLIVLLQAVGFYHLTVRRIPLKWGLVACAALAVLFSAAELLRVQGFDLASARSAVSEEGFRPALEFGSVFFPGFHLYAERAQGTLPAREWPMLYSDFVSLFTFGDYARWNPMSWYTRNYFPELDVSPVTVGPIAESAIWGGTGDLLVRSVINGIFFALVMRWFLRHKNRWWGLAVYVYCYATCILTLKYTVLLHLTLIEKNLVLTLLLVQAARLVRFTRPRTAVRGVPQVACGAGGAGG